MEHQSAAINRESERLETDPQAHYNTIQGKREETENQ
jgi:hypothetical protein